MRLLLNEAAQDVLRFSDIGLIRNADFDFQLSAVHCRHVDDGVIRKIGVRDHDGTVVDAVDCRVIHLNLFDRSLLTFAREDDVVTDLKWLQQQNHHAACKVREAALQCQGYGNAGGGDGCCDRRFGYDTELNDNGQHQQRVQTVFHHGNGETDHRLLRVKTPHVFPDQTTEPQDQFACNQKQNYRKHDLQHQIGSRRGLVDPVFIDAFRRCQIHHVLSLLCLEFSLQLLAEFTHACAFFRFCLWFCL